MSLLTLVALADLSLVGLFAYIGFARPVRQGSADLSGVPWPFSKLSKTVRFIVFCGGGGAGASIAISMAWAKWMWIKTPTDIDYRTMWIGIGLALFAMIVVPCGAYFYRYLSSTYAVRRESLSVGTNGTNAAIQWRRVRAESIAALIAATGAAGLYAFFAYHVFKKPLESLVTFDGVSPFLLAGESLASPRLLFLCFAEPTVLFILFLQATIFVAGSGRYNEDYDREWWGRTGGWLISGSIAWLLLSGIAIFGPLVIYQFPAIVGAIGGASGLVALVLGGSPKWSAQHSDAKSRASEKALSLAVPLFCVFLLAVISWLTTVIIQTVESTAPVTHPIEAQLQTVVTLPEQKLKDRPAYRETLRSQPIPSTPAGVLAAHAHLITIESTRLWELFWIGLIGLAAFGASFAVGVNRFSMHALYRNRLIRAYLGASRYDRDPDPLTGFDPYDNLEMYKLRAELLWSTSFGDFDAFLADLRKALAGLPAKSLSPTIVDLMQQTTRDMLTNGETLDAVLAQIESLAVQKTTAVDVGTIEFVRGAVERVRSYLPRTIKQLAKVHKLDAILAAAKKDVQKQKRRFGGSSRGILVDAMIQDLNRILIDEDLTGKKPPADRRARMNRVLFDKTYADWVVAMPCVERTDPAPEHATEWRPPLHVVNAALNLVGGKNLAWQQRMAESFTISSLHSGSPFVGYRDSREYGSKTHGISLGTAVTISGAAASPNQGYHSSVPVAFLLTMFNIRLGCWLGNPGTAGKDTYRKDNPSSTVALLAREMVGETNDTSKWIYLSDGGHFENLGLYEMVLRRCRYVVVSDGGCDPRFTFEDLGNAIRKIRTDFGIPITFDEMSMRARDEESSWNYVAVGKIDYAAVDGCKAKPGTLIYIKPGYYRDEGLPKDVLNYAKECSDFPHETTADQWFSESQFESYRTLGWHVVKHIAGRESAPSVAQFAKNVKEAKSVQTEYVPVVAERISIKEGGLATTAVVLPSKGRISPRA